MPGAVAASTSWASTRARVLRIESLTGNPKLPQQTPVALDPQGRLGHDNNHVRGHKEEGTTTTPFDMCVINDLDRFHLVNDVIDRGASPRALPLWRRYAGNQELDVGTGRRRATSSTEEDNL